MGLASRLGAAWRGLSGKSGSVSNSMELLRTLFAQPSKSGENVTWQTSLQVSTVLACARVIAEGLAMTPFKVMRSDGRERHPATDHPLYEILYRRPNDWQTAFEFRQQQGLHLALCFNAYAFINRVQGRVAELLPIQPHLVTVEQKPDWSLAYKVRMPGGELLPVPAMDIWHVRGPTWDGVRGLEAVRLAREAIGLSMAAETSQAHLHKDGVRPSGILSVEGTLTKEQYEQLHAYLKETMMAGASSGGVMIVDHDGKFTPTTMTGVDAQHLETRRFQIEEVCRFMRVAPIMVGHPDKTATYASAEQMFLAHVVHSMGPHYVRIEQSADVHLLTEDERAAGLYTKFNANALMRGDAKTRADFYAKALGAGGSPAWMTQNEVRELEELNPIAGGDVLHAPTTPPSVDVAEPDADDEPGAASMADDEDGDE